MQKRTLLHEKISCRGRMRERRAGHLAPARRLQPRLPRKTGVGVETGTLIGGRIRSETDIQTGTRKEIEAETVIGIEREIGVKTGAETETETGNEIEEDEHSRALIYWLFSL